MLATAVVPRPTRTSRTSRTSWGAVLDGWLATVGVAAILTPIVGIVLANYYPTLGYSATVPVLAGVGLSYLVGGYVAGRMAGYRTSWHGMTVAFFGLFVVLALLVIDIALSLGSFGATGRLIQLLPAVLGATLFTSVETFAFGGAISMLVAIFAAWLGGLLAPARSLALVTPAPATAAPVTLEQGSAAEVHRPRRRYRLLPSPSRKGHERVEDVVVVEPAVAIEPR